MELQESETDYLIFLQQPFPFLIIILFAVEKVTVHVLVLYKKCTNPAIKVFSVYSGLTKRDEWIAFNWGENKLTACSESRR